MLSPVLVFVSVSINFWKMRSYLVTNVCVPMVSRESWSPLKNLTQVPPAGCKHNLHAVKLVYKV